MNPGARGSKCADSVRAFRGLFKLLALLAGVGVFFTGSGQSAGPLVRPQANGGFAAQQCSDGNDRGRLSQFDRIMKKNVPSYKEFPHIGFFIYDLTDPSNNYTSPHNRLREKGCITFTDGHVYHFSTISLAASASQIAIFENGKPKVFRSINCYHGKAGLAGVLTYVNQTLTGKNKQDTITRLEHYRRYGEYWIVDHTEYTCGQDRIPRNSDKLYSRRELLYRFAEVVREESVSVQRNYPDFLIEGEQAVGFFVYDLTDPANKQTSLLEHIEFRNGHVYHFADIDLPYSYSNIAVLEDGRVKIFKTLNCAGKGDDIDEVISYLDRKLTSEKNKAEIIDRVRNYRKYGTYVSFNGISTPQCQGVAVTEVR